MWKKLSLLFTLIAAGSVVPASAQYFLVGTDPAYIRWEQLRGDHFRVIYPDYYAWRAGRIAGYLEWARPYITHGLDRGPVRVPILLHPENLRYNGVVSWAPKRSELFTTPPLDNFAVPWDQQLSLHEYRHVVQMSNLDRGITRVASYLLGQQIVGLVAAILPGWYLEGDATVAETRLSVYGRGLQPDFTIEYRAMLNEDRRLPSLDKLICGSIKDNIPDKYKLGYQLVSGGETLYGPEFWGKMVAYTARYPFLIVTPAIAFRKYARTNTSRLTSEVFGQLKKYWAPASAEENSARILRTPYTSYTVYRYPLQADSAFIVALKEDFDRTSRWVVMDRRTGRERTLRYTGGVSSRPALRGSRLYWTEYRPSLFWPQKNHSVVRSLELSRFPRRKDRPRTVSGPGAWYFVTPLPQDRFALMTYDTLSNSVVVITDGRFREQERIPLGKGVALNGLAWDQKASRLVFIALDDSGMWLGAIDPATRQPVRLTEPSYVTRRNLTVSDGKFYFNSIQSGKDEIHVYDPDTGRESRLTTSKYGSVAPSARGDNVVFTTYGRRGYFVAEQREVPDSLVPVEPSRLPVNRLNPPRRSWDVPRIDTVPPAAFRDTFPRKRFRKGLRLFNVHSWMPFSLDVDKLVNERELQGGWGVTLLSQSLLDNMVATATYGWVHSSSLVRASLTYTGWPVHIGAVVEYGGGKQNIYTQNDAHTDKLEEKGLKNYLEAGGYLSLPFNFSSGRHLRSLTPSVAYRHYNSYVYNTVTQARREGFDKLVYGLTWSNAVAMARKDLRPRTGYLLRLSGALNPLHPSSFGRLYSAYGQFYLPGIALHHSLMLRGAVQYQDMNTYNFRQKDLFPRGCDYDYAPRNLYAASLDYKFPLLYPDNGIPSILYVKRVSVNLFSDYARYRHRTASGYVTREPYSYGGDIDFDLHVFRTTYALGLTLSLYKPSDRNGMAFEAGVGIDF